jgi:hypothetical protein
MSEKVLSNQRVTVLAGLASGITDWAEVTLAELTALTNVSGAVNWDSFDLNLQASQQSDDRTLTDGAGAQSRGYTNFGGALQFVNPRVDDLASVYRTAYDIFSTPRVELVVAVRYGKPNSSAPAAGDRFTIYHVITDAVSFGQGDVSKFYSVNLIARDDILPNYIVPAASPATITITVVDASVGVDDLVFVSAAYEGWDVTKEVTWVSSDETDIIMVHPGIFQAKGTGTPTVKATYPGATDSSTSVITIA